MPFTNPMEKMKGKGFLGDVAYGVGHGMRDVGNAVATKKGREATVRGTVEGAKNMAKQEAKYIAADCVAPGAGQAWRACDELKGNVQKAQHIRNGRLDKAASPF